MGASVPGAGWSVLASLLLAVAGCSAEGDKPGGSGSTCVSSADCGSGLICTDGRCTTAPDGGGDVDGGGGTDGGGGSCLPADRCGSVCCADGEECVDDTCLASCESGLRCGAALACCADGDLCISEECVTPGDTCTEELDCEVGWYCDAELGRCLPRGPDRCEYHPPSGVFEPTEQWAWDGSTVAPDSVHVMMAPVVGDITGDGIPEVVFGTYTAAGSYGGPGVLRAVRGDTGEAVLDVTDPVTCPEGGIALGDLDGDGTPEIVTSGPCTGPILAFRNDGTLWWSSKNPDDSAFNANMEFGAPSIADLEGDGLAEVIVGGTVIEHDGVVRWSKRQVGTNCCGDDRRAPVSAVYDVDGDGALEVVGGNVAWEADGTVLWEDTTAPDGYVALADFFDDDVPDVVVVHTGNVSIRRGTDGMLLWGPVAQPGGGRGGPPTVADFDGDGLPEIGVAGAASYSVFDPDGDTDVLWSQTTQDASSNITGSSVFDFDGDGEAEVVYNDECYMRVYAGSDGTVLEQVPQNSHTLIEYPLIVDVDADGNAEIVFAANAAVNRCGHISGYAGLQAGIRVFRDGADNWVNTRKVWNQHAYSITNVREDLRIPRTVQPNWRRFNSFRKNPQSFDAPNLVAVDVAADESACPPAMTLEATVENRGAVSVAPGLAVSFYLGTTASPGRLLGTVRTTSTIVPGGSETVTLAFDTMESERGTELDFFVRVDDVGDGTGEHNECVEDDNEAAATFECGVIE